MRVQRLSQLPIIRHAPSTAERPRCYGCGMAREAVYGPCDENGELCGYLEAVGRAFAGWRGYGHFHSQDCATAYANWVAENKGIRLVLSGSGS